MKDIPKQANVQLNKNQIAILKVLSDGYGGERCYYYRYLEGDTGLDRKTLEIEIKELKKIGFVEAVRGLMTEDGEVAGSGFTIPYRKMKEVEPLLADMKQPSERVEQPGDCSGKCIKHSYCLSQRFLELCESKVKEERKALLSKLKESLQRKINGICCFQTPPQSYQGLNEAIEEINSLLNRG